MSRSSTSRTLTAAQVTARDNARATLRGMFPIGSTVSTKLLHVSRSGMLRSVAVLHGKPDGTVDDVSDLVSIATGNKLHRGTGGVEMGGCGMGMGFALVYSLSNALYYGQQALDHGQAAPGREPFVCTGTGYATNEGDVEGPANACPSNDHFNERTAANGYTSNYSHGRIHSDAGYALNQRWI